MSNVDLTEDICKNKRVVKDSFPNIFFYKDIAKLTVTRHRFEILKVLLNCV